MSQLIGTWCKRATLCTGQKFHAGQMCVIELRTRPVVDTLCVIGLELNGDTKNVRYWARMMSLVDKLFVIGLETRVELRRVCVKVAGCELGKVRG